MSVIFKPFILICVVEIVLLLGCGDALAQYCSNPPVRISGVVGGYYAGIQEAYDAAYDGAVIQIQAMEISGDIDFNRSIAVTLDGGYDCDFISSVGKTTVVGDITVSNGQVMMNNIMVSTGPEVFDVQINASPGGGVETDDLICGYKLGGTATTAAVAWYRDGIPEMRLYMPFEGNGTNALLDYSGNGNMGVKGGGVTWNAAGGYDGKGAFEFDGGPYADINVGDIMPSGAYTKVAWIRISGGGRNNIISGDSGHAFWAPDIYGGKLSAGHNGNWAEVQDSVALSQGTWYFVAVSYDPSVNGGEMVLYRDGVEVDRAVGVPAHDLSDKKVWIGSYKGSYNFNGTIDDVRIYEHALTPEQIWELYNSGGTVVSSSETVAGEQWQAYVTPFSASESGATVGTNTVVIQGSGVGILDYIEIEGPGSVNENSGVDYNGRAYYTDGTNHLVEPVWSVDCPLVAGISGTGLLTTYEVVVDEPCTITATYSEGGVTATATLNIVIVDVIRIMPLGDSITKGKRSSDGAGYRRYLDYLLTGAGYNFDLIGSQQNGPFDFDRDHEGHAGWYANEIRDNVYNWLVINPADVILLHIGTNDISANQNIQGIVAEVEQILDNIDQYEMDYGRHIAVFLALIINRDNPTSSYGLATTSYNDQLFVMAQNRINNGDDIEIVDMEPALIYPDDMYDTVHPNDIGYDKMASEWFSAIDLYLAGY
jgi:lysophospholipase L1-like esterase